MTNSDKPLHEACVALTNPSMRHDAGSGQASVKAHPTSTPLNSRLCWHDIWRHAEVAQFRDPALADSSQRLRDSCTTLDNGRQWLKWIARFAVFLSKEILHSVFKVCLFHLKCKMIRIRLHTCNICSGFQHLLPKFNCKLCHFAGGQAKEKRHNTTGGYGGYTATHMHNSHYTSSIWSSGQNAKTRILVLSPWGLAATRQEAKVIVILEHQKFQGQNKLQVPLTLPPGKSLRVWFLLSSGDSEQPKCFLELQKCQKSYSDQDKHEGPTGQVHIQPSANSARLWQEISKGFNRFQAWFGTSPPHPPRATRQRPASGVLPVTCHWLMIQELHWTTNRFNRSMVLICLNDEKWYTSGPIYSFCKRAYFLLQNL